MDASPLWQPTPASVAGAWPLRAPRSGARHTIQTYISELRRNLDDDIRRVGVGYLLDVDRADPGVPRSARLVIHDAVTLDRVHEIEGGGWPLGFTADSSQLLVGGAGRVRVVDVTSGDIEAEVVVVPPDADSVLELGGGGFVGDGRHVVATAHLGREGWIVDVESHQVVAIFCGAGGGSRAAVSPDGSIVAVGSATAVTEIWDVSTLVADGGSTCEEEVRDGLVRTLEGDAALDLSFNAQGDRLAAAGFDGVVTVWEVETGETRLRIEHDAQVGGAAFSPDGHRLLVTVNDAGGTQHAVHVYTLDPTSSLPSPATAPHAS